VESYKIRALGKLGIESRVEIVRYAAPTRWLQDL
jgi:DNA-binding NarL/FixJ family response regulator